jgi:O-antigen/teichoic acid export membrane protein
VTTNLAPIAAPEVATSARPGVEEKVVQRMVRRGSAIELTGYAMSQILRLVTNLVLSRLLFPEAYGLTTIVTVFMVALGMLTDVGLRDSIINNPRGDDPEFVNTAWTIQIVRGFGLWIAATVIAFPVAWIYHRPELRVLIAVAAFSNAIHGFESTKLHTLSRHVKRGPLLLVEVGAKAVSMLVMFVWAWIHPSVWALVAGGMAQSIGEVIGSHLLPAHYKNRIQWHRESARAITSFGKWVFGSSAFTFLAGEGDRILLGRFMTMAALGVYSIAGVLTSSVGIVVNRLSYSVFYGVLSKVARESREDLERHYYAARLKLDLLVMPALGGLMVLGPVVVGVLYDRRYADAGWMLQILAARVALQSALQLAGVCLMTINRPQYHLPANAARFVAVWCGIPIGYHFGGLRGVIWATTLSELPMLFVFGHALRKAKLWKATRELVAPLGILAGVAAAWAVRLVLRRLVPGLHGV